MDSLSLLLRSPSRWTPEHLRMLNLIEHNNVPASGIVGTRYLPEDGDEEFETLATYFIQPTDEDLANFVHKRSVYWRNIFHFVFARLSEAAKSEHWLETSKQAIFTLFDVILSHVEVENLSISLLSKLPFEIRSCGVRGAVKCEGILTSTTPSSRLLGTFLVLEGNDDSYIAYAVSHLLLQGILAYEHTMTIVGHTAFIVRTDRTVLQISMAHIPHIYIKEITQGKALSKNLEVYHSERYDLCKQSQRKEALRLIIGLFRLLNDKRES